MIKDMKTVETILESSKTNHLAPFFPHPEEVLFFDIETTGFSPKNAVVYLIGCAFFTKSGWKIRQYFSENRSQEKELLETFCSFASSFSHMVHFNGTTFDIPFLQERCKKHGIAPFLPCAQTDLYKRISPYKNLLHLPGCRQKQLEQAIGLFREDSFTGGHLIELYHSFSRQPDERLLEVLLLHNREDLSGMLAVCSLMAVPCLFTDKQFQILKLQPQDAPAEAGGTDELFVTLQLSMALPFPVACHSSPDASRRCYFSGSQNRAILKVPVRCGELKYFYPDYKNYSYLPAEDRAIHKSVAVYVDKAHRMPARAATCYVRKSGRFLPWPGAAPENLPLFKETHNSKDFWIAADPSFFGDSSLQFLWVSLLLNTLAGRKQDKT